MGGILSGNRSYRYGRKRIVEECLILNADILSRDGLFRCRSKTRGVIRWASGGKVYATILEADLTETDAPQLSVCCPRIKAPDAEPEIAYHIPLAVTEPHFGGLRWWLVCPLANRYGDCGRRVTKLYLPPSEDYFGCRQCHRLTYQTCRDSRKPTAFDRMIADRSGVSLREYLSILKNKIT